MFNFQKLAWTATLALFLSGVSASPRPLVVRNNGNDNSTFVTANNGQFFLGDRTFYHFGTNAYYLPSYNDANIELTFNTMAANGITVVRTWAFNDVSKAPQGVPFFQVLSNGQQTINEGADGLQRLDKVVQAAANAGIRLVLTLTNNWTSKPNPSLPPLFLSDDFGGMDVYVQAFKPGGTHDDFYTDSNIISAFKNYIQHVVSRYSNNPTVLGWELANDPRCGSSAPASSSCNTHTITTWVNEISGFIKSIDSKHLVTAGDGGFFCEGCPKLFAKSQKRSPHRRNNSPGSAFDGSFGVDTEDIIAVPCIDFGSFQLFPDQDDYGTFSPIASFAVNSIATGNSWIIKHAQTGQNAGKPVSLLAFGIVLQEDWSHFIPVNASTGPLKLHGSGDGVTDDQGVYARTAWTSTGFNEHFVGGIFQYQWTQTGLSSTSAVQSRQSNAAGGTSANDGYPTGPYPNVQTSSQLMTAQNFMA